MSDIVEVPLTNGEVAIVDAADYHIVSGFTWYAQKVYRKDGSLYQTYAYRRENWTVRKGKYAARYIRMHRAIMGFPKRGVDHHDNNGLNNRRSNLRRATNGQNQSNRRKFPGATSRWKGVYWFPNYKKWHASISHNKKRVSLGYYKDEADAATAYNLAASELHKEFARYNVPIAA